MVGFCSNFRSNCIEANKRSLKNYKKILYLYIITIMSSFRETLTNINSKCENYSLVQAMKLKKQREGFKGIPNDLKEGDSMYNMWGTDKTFESNVGKKRNEWNDYQMLTYGENGADNNKFKEWTYKIATFGIHKDKMDKALLNCRKRCNEVVGSGEKVEKQVQGCQIGCVVAYPRYANPTSTFIPEDNDGSAWTKNDSIDLKVAKGNEICNSLSSGASPICKNGIIIADESQELDKIGEFGAGSPRTHCAECGGISSIIGKFSYRMDDVVKNGRSIPNGGLITDTKKVTNSGILTGGGTGLGCDNISDPIIKNACKCVAGEPNAQNCGDIKNNKFYVDGQGNPIKATYASSEFSEDLNRFSTRIGTGDSTWRVNDTGEKSLSQRYAELTAAAKAYQQTSVQTSKQFDKINNFIKKSPQDIKKLESNINSNLDSLIRYADDVENSKLKKETLDGRYEDALLKKESQLYKNWAGGILAISLFTMAVYKLRQI